MIRTVIALLPAGSRPQLGAQIALTVLGHVLRAVGAVTLIPLVEALFTGDDRAAWLWLAVLAAATVLGWVVDVAAARRAYEIGFAMLGSGQPAVADRIARVRLGWFTPENKATTRQAVAPRWMLCGQSASSAHCACFPRSRSLSARSSSAR